MLRAIKFSARLGFSIEGQTRAAILSERAEIGKAALPRLYEELVRLAGGRRLWCVDPTHARLTASGDLDANSLQHLQLTDENGISELPNCLARLITMYTKWPPRMAFCSQCSCGL